MPLTDNVNLHIKSLPCARGDDPMAATASSGRCLGTGESAVIYVNSNDFYFNITKSAEFSNVVFDGINQFGYIREAYAFADRQAVSEGIILYDKLTKTPYWPHKFCDFIQLEEDHIVQDDNKT